MKTKMKAVALASVMAMGLAAATTAQAHPRWVLPSHFTVSKEGGDWLTFDVTASHGTFVFDKPAGSEQAFVIMPDGRSERPNFVVRGKRRSMFDFFFVEEGTHKVAINNQPSYYTQYKAGRRDTVKWAKASKADRASVIPEKARDVVTQLSYTRAESYVTVGMPTDKALEIEGKLLEMKPITHPSDIIEGEEVIFQFFFNGEPQQGVTAEITREGTLYRNHQEQIDVVSDKDGKITFTPDVAGRYLMKANYKGELKNDPLADKASMNVHLTFETQLN
ncbi:putative exported protein [Vibrio owensii]|uniref:Exported protein n=2 Tax=Vibrio harveyi group TaxID=717610 RepID=A0AAU9Q3X3_9VIBR|nr:putative exported protein [Vibrio owensii]